MDKKIFFALFLAFLVMPVLASAQYKNMVSPSLPEYCLNNPLVLDKNWSENDIKDCLKYTFLLGESACERIPEKFGAEFKENCFLKGLFCDKISSAELKQQCAEAKAKKQFNDNWKSFWYFIQSIAIPLGIVAIILSGLIDFFRKKLDKKGILIRIALIVFLAITWFVIVGVFCFNCLFD